MQTMRLGATFLLAGIVAVGCSSSSSPTAHPRRPLPVPVRGDGEMIRIDTRGGLTPIEDQLGIVPQLSIFGDGRIVVSGPVTEQYPPHALPNLLTGTLPRDAMARLVQRARADHLLGGGRDFGQPTVTHLPTTTVTIYDPPCLPTASCARRPPALHAYALDFTDAAVLAGLTADQRAARRQLAGFVRTATDWATRVATKPYSASEVAIFVRTAATPLTTDGALPGRATWPLGQLATFGSADSPPGYRCGVLTGTDARTALAAAANATSITRWQSAGAEYTIVWLPLLPDQHQCPGWAIAR